MFRRPSRPENGVRGHGRLWRNVLNIYGCRDTGINRVRPDPHNGIRNHDTLMKLHDPRRIYVLGILSCFKRNQRRHRQVVDDVIPPL